MRPPRSDGVTIPLAPLRRVLTLLVAAAILLALAAAGATLWTQRDRIAGTEARFVDPGTYQAVFLVSSQVYFGKLTIEGEDYLLRDVFYLNAPQQGTSAGQLVKRGNELHGPMEPMVIPARSVLFFENMRQDAEVMAAIRAFKAGATPAPNPQPSATPQGSVAPPPTAPSARPSPSR